MTEVKESSIEVRIKPWWQTPLFVAIVGAVLALTPWLFEKIVGKTSNEPIISPAKIYVKPQSLLFEFTDKSRRFVNVQITLGTKVEATRWIEVAMPNGIRKFGMNYGVGEYRITIPKLACDRAFKTIPMASVAGVQVAGETGQLNVKCNNLSS